MNTSAVAVLASLILLLPVAGALCNGLVGARLPRAAVNLVGTGIGRIVTGQAVLYCLEDKLKDR